MSEVELPNAKEFHQLYFAIIAAILGALFALNSFYDHPSSFIPLSAR